MSKLEISVPYIQDWPDIDRAITRRKIARRSIRHVSVSTTARECFIPSRDNPMVGRSTKEVSVVIMLHNGEQIALPELTQLQYEKKSK